MNTATMLLATIAEEGVAAMIVAEAEAIPGTDEVEVTAVVGVVVMTAAEAGAIPEIVAEVATAEAGARDAAGAMILEDATVGNVRRRTSRLRG